MLPRRSWIDEVSLNIIYFKIYVKKSPSLSQNPHLSCSLNPLILRNLSQLSRPPPLLEPHSRSKRDRQTLLSQLKRAGMCVSFSLLGFACVFIFIYFYVVLVFACVHFVFIWAVIFFAISSSFSSICPSRPL